MNAWQRRLLWWATAVVTASGLLYAVLRYLVPPSDPFSAYNHPLQPWSLDAHVLLAPVLLFALGWFWGNHVLPKLKRRVPGRPSGLALLGLIVIMTASGYLLQVLSASSFRPVLAWIHGLSGVAYFALLLGHAILAPKETGTLSVSAAPGAGRPHFGSGQTTSQGQTLKNET